MLGLTLKITCCGFFSFHILLEMKEKHPKHYMDNFEAIIISSSIKLTIEGAIPTFFIVSSHGNGYMQGIEK